MARLGFSCLGLSEVCWMGKGHYGTERGSLVIYSGSEVKREAGVAMMLDKRSAGALFSYNPISNRVLTVRLAAKLWNPTLIQVYAPTNQASVAEKNRFYTSLQQVLSQVPNQDVVVLSGDFNAKLGKGAPISELALGVRNDNGERLSQFAEVNRLVTANTIRRQHPRHQYTWCAPGGKCRNQIDYILLSRRWLSSMDKCKTCPGADADTENVVVRLEFKLKLHRLPKKKSTPQYNLSEKERFQLELRNRYQFLDKPGAADPKNVMVAAERKRAQRSVGMVE